MKKNEKEYYEKVWNEIEKELAKQHDSLWQEHQEYLEEERMKQYEKHWREIDEELTRQYDSLWQEYQEYIELNKWKIYRIYLEFLTGDEQYN